MATLQGYPWKPRLSGVLSEFRTPSVFYSISTAPLFCKSVVLWVTITENHDNKVFLFQKTIPLIASVMVAFFTKLVRAVDEGLSPAASRFI